MSCTLQAWSEWAAVVHMSVQFPLACRVGVALALSWVGQFLVELSSF